MQGRNHKAAKVIEQEGEVDEDQEDEEQENQDSEGSSGKMSQINGQNNTIRSDNSLDKSANKSQIVLKDRVFDDIIGLKQHFEEYKNNEIIDITARMQKLQVAQENNQNEFKKVKHNISEEDKIKEIRQTFQLAPLYILKLKGLKNRMSKIEDKLSKAKTKLVSEMNTLNNISTPNNK